MDGDHSDMSISYPPSQALYGADPVLVLWNLLARPTIDPATLARAIETVGKIQVRLVDAVDIIAGKVYSARPKDLDDFRLLPLNLNKEELKERVLQGSSSLISSDQDRRQAITNWYIVYGDDLGLSPNSSAGDSP
jgi:hypothetical protein